jgi:hypothetical protein
MGDIPGLDYKAPVPIDRESLKGHDITAKPKTIDRYDGSSVETLEWDYPEGEWTSASPAHSIAFSEVDPSASTDEVLNRLWKCLEVPGESADYHFGIQGTARVFWEWRRRRLQPELTQCVEWLSWLDIRLIRARPSTIWVERRRDEGQYVAVLAFAYLRQIYETEGFLAKALEVAQEATKFDQMSEEAESLEERLAALRAEDEH